MLIGLWAHFRPRHRGPFPGPGPEIAIFFPGDIFWVAVFGNFFKINSKSLGFCKTAPKSQEDVFSTF